MPIKNGLEYVESLRNRNLQIYLFGELVKEPVDHPMMSCGMLAPNSHNAHMTGPGKLFYSDLHYLLYRLFDQHASLEVKCFYAVPGYKLVVVGKLLIQPVIFPVVHHIPFIFIVIYDLIS